MEVAPKRAGFAPERINRITDHLNRNYISPARSPDARRWSRAMATSHISNHSA